MSDQPLVLCVGGMARSEHESVVPWVQTLANLHARGAAIESIPIAHDALLASDSGIRQPDVHDQMIDHVGRALAQKMRESDNVTLFAFSGGVLTTVIALSQRPDLQAKLRRLVLVAGPWLANNLLLAAIHEIKARHGDWRTNEAVHQQEVVITEELTVLNGSPQRWVLPFGFIGWLPELVTRARQALIEMVVPTIVVQGEDDECVQATITNHFAARLTISVVRRPGWRHLASLLSDTRAEFADYMVEQYLAGQEEAGSS